MNQAEANAIVTIMSLGFPGSRFTAENAEVYERAIGDLDADTCRSAVENLIRENRFMPSVAEIRAEYLGEARRQVGRRNAELAATRAIAALPPVAGAGMRQQWGKALENMLEASSRHRAMAERWYRERGKPVPPDPMAPFIEVAKAGAKGSDVSDRFRSEVLPEDDSERRYP